ncbi:amidohydrolase family protein [Nocardia iowensis]|uniref:Amidohydrolase family protein n=1 Tax=Nocardia iowensis TaxID=204891 RepID=A0ABX8RLT0_NOCIO|nr:amidohydrolase family protein [Nocardia iowensis]QXN89385.1 amidohydrolase family protein [Nocardia iowensis]
MTPRQRVFDAHAHLAPGPEAVARLIETMDRCRIDRAVVVAGGAITPDQLSRQLIEGGYVATDADNDAVLAGCDRSGGRLVPFFFANPHRGGADYRAHGRHFRGLKLAPSVHGVGLLDERTIALVEQAEGFGHGVYLHCVQRPGFGVAALVTLAERFPAVEFVLGHAGVGDLDLYGIDLIKPRPNVVFETSGGFTFVVKTALDRLGADRVLFGTEYPLQHPDVELAKYRVLDLSEDDWRRVAWQNTCRLTGETDG